MTENFATLVRGSGPGLLLAHGGGGTVAANFGPIIAELARTHTVIGPDYPGSGDTPRARGPLSLDGLADGLVGAAVEAGVSRFDILGYSLGTAVAVRAASRHPERVTGLVLTAGFAYPTPRIRLAVDIWRTLLGRDRRLLAAYLTLVGTGENYLNTLGPEELEAAIDGLADFIPTGSREHVDLVEAIDVRAELGTLAVPALVIATTLDELASPVLSRELADAIPGARLVEIEAGHGIGVEAPERWLAAIRDFLVMED